MKPPSRTHSVSFLLRLTQDEMAILERMAFIAKTNCSEVLRQLIKAAKENSEEKGAES